MLNHRLPSYDGDQSALSNSTKEADVQVSLNFMSHLTKPLASMPTFLGQWFI